MKITRKYFYLSLILMFFVFPFFGHALTFKDLKSKILILQNKFKNLNFLVNQQAQVISSPYVLQKNSPVNDNPIDQLLSGNAVKNISVLLNNAVLSKVLDYNSYQNLPVGNDNVINGYIIKFPSSSLAEKYSEASKSINLLEKQLKNSEKNLQPQIQGKISDLILERKLAVNSQKNLLIQEHSSKIANIKFVIPSVQIKKEFFNSFNGVYVVVSEDNVKKLRSKGFSVYPNRIVKALLEDSVPLIQADKVWQLKDNENRNITGEGIKIAIIDTGVDYTHKDLGGCFGDSTTTKCKVIGGYDVINNDSDPIDDMGHGTHVASIAAGAGNVKGVAPDAKILAYKVLNQYGVGYSSDIISGLDYALDPNKDNDLSDKADVMNLSLGGRGDPDDALSQAVDSTVSAGSVVVVSAGNNGPSYYTIASPGTARKAITVAASDKSDTIAEFSSRGPVVWDGKSIMKPDITAPGVKICAAEWSDWLSEKRCRDDNHIAISGTSMAAPHIAGVAALMKQKNPLWTPDEIKNVLKETANPTLSNPFFAGAGRVDALKAAQSPLIPVDEITNIESPGEIRGLYNKKYSLLASKYNIKGKINPEAFLNYKIEIGKSDNVQAKNIVYEEIFRSSVLPNGEYIASYIPFPQEYGMYVLKLTVNFSNKPSVIKYSYVFNLTGSNFELAMGWPQKPFDFKSGFWGVGSTPILYDLDNDDKKEIITFSKDQVTVWRSDGSLMPGWPQKVTYGAVTTGSLPPPSIGDIDGDGKPEIVMIEFFVANFIRDGKACGHAWKIDGSKVKGWLNDCDNVSPVITDITKGTSLLYDIDNDGAMEIVMRTSKSNDDFDGSLYILKGDASVVSGWPKIFKGDFTKYLHMPAVGNVDDDKKSEIVELIGCENINSSQAKGKIIVYNYNGNEKNSFSVLTPNCSLDNILLVDLDNDGKKEIGYLTSNESVVFYHNDGSIVSGWPFEHSPNQKDSLISADLFGDGNFEIIFSYHKRVSPGKEYITILDKNGKELSGWPKEVTGLSLWVRPQTGDIYQFDGSPVITTTTSAGLVYAWNRNGYLLKGFPLEMKGESQSGTAIGDIDNDGNMELVAGTQNGEVYVWRFFRDQRKAPIVVDKNFKGYKYWPMWKQNPQNTGTHK